MDWIIDFLCCLKNYCLMHYLIYLNHYLILMNFIYCRCIIDLIVLIVLIVQALKIFHFKWKYALDLRSTIALFNTRSFTFLNLELLYGLVLLLNSLIYSAKWFCSSFAGYILINLVLISLPKECIVLHFLKSCLIISFVNYFASISSFPPSKLQKESR